MNLVKKVMVQPFIITLKTIKYFLFLLKVRILKKIKHRNEFIFGTIRLSRL